MSLTASTENVSPLSNLLSFSNTDPSQRIQVAVRIRNTGTIQVEKPLLPDTTPFIQSLLYSRPLSYYISDSCIELARVVPPVNSLTIKDPEGRKRKKDFSYDHIFTPRDSQQDVYDKCVRPLIQKCLEGFNGSVFCYGQTGSGKTYTMEGPQQPRKESDDGIILRAAQQISQHIQERSQGTERMECMMKASYMEIYQEQLTDLLVDKHEQGNLKCMIYFVADLKIRMDPESLSGKELYVQGLTERAVSSLKDFEKLLKLGSKRRTGEPRRHINKSGRNKYERCIKSISCYINHHH
jgi:hypothetical protein